MGIDGEQVDSYQCNYPLEVMFFLLYVFYFLHFFTIEFQCFICCTSYLFWLSTFLMGKIWKKVTFD